MPETSTARCLHEVYALVLLQVSYLGSKTGQSLESYPCRETRESFLEVVWSVHCLWEVAPILESSGLLGPEFLAPYGIVSLESAACHSYAYRFGNRRLAPYSFDGDPAPVLLIPALPAAASPLARGYRIVLPPGVSAGELAPVELADRVGLRLTWGRWSRLSLCSGRDDRGILIKGLR